MKRRRLIWPSTRPRPFESAWSICGTALVLNRIRADELKKLIGIPGQSEVNLRTGQGIDFLTFSSLLDVDEERLRQGFLSSMGFVGARLHKHVHHCPDCLKHGYHSAFFEWDIVNRCPVHNRQLFPCSVCGFLTQAGPKRTFRDLPYRSSYEFREEFHGDIYHSACGHIQFDFQFPQAKGDIGNEIRDGFQTLGEKMSEWIGRVKASRDIAKPIVASFGSYHHGTSLNYRADIIRRVAGEIPIHQSITEKSFFANISGPGIKPRPASFLSWEQSECGSLSAQDYQCLEEEKGCDRIMKSVCRQVFKRFVKPHHSHCWREFRKYGYGDAQSLSFKKACMVCVAFSTWILESKRICNIESFRSRHSANFSHWRDRLYFYRHPSAYAHILFSQFLLALDELERLGRESMHVEIIQRCLSLYERNFLTEGEIRQDGQARFWMLLPNIEHLERVFSMRCLGRPKTGRTMIHNLYFGSFDWEQDTSQKTPLFRLFCEGPAIRTYRFRL